jgi:hypothetical protein
MPDEYKVHVEDLFSGDTRFVYVGSDKEKATDIYGDYLKDPDHFETTMFINGEED